MLALAQTLSVAPGLPPPEANLLPGHEAAVAAAHQRVVAAAEQLPPQHDVEAFAARFAGQLPAGSIAARAAPAVPCCAPLAASAAHLQPAAQACERPVQGGPAAAVPSAAEPAGTACGAEASGDVGCTLEEGGGDSSGEWVPAAQAATAHALAEQQQQQQQQQQQAAEPADGWGPRGVPLAIGGGRTASPQRQPHMPPQVQAWQRVIPQDGWGVPGIPLAIGGGRPPAPALPVALAQPLVAQAAPVQPLLPAPPAAQQQEQQAQQAQQAQQPSPDDPGDGWGPRGMPLLLGGGRHGPSCVLAQVLATCESQAASSAVFSAEGRALQALGVPPPNNPAIRRRVEVRKFGLQRTDVDGGRTGRTVNPRDRLLHVCSRPLTAACTALDWPTWQRLADPSILTFWPTQAVQDVASIQRLQRRLLGTVRDCWPAAAAAQFAPGSPARQALEEAAVEMSTFFWWVTIRCLVGLLLL